MSDGASWINVGVFGAKLKNVQIAGLLLRNGLNPRRWQLAELSTAPKKTRKSDVIEGFCRQSSIFVDVVPTTDTIPRTFKQLKLASIDVA